MTLIKSMKEVREGTKEVSNQELSWKSEQQCKGPEADVSSRKKVQGAQCGRSRENLGRVAGHKEGRRKKRLCRPFVGHGNKFSFYSEWKMKPWDGLSMQVALWDLWFEKNGLVFLLRLDYGGRQVNIFHYSDQAERWWCLKSVLAVEMIKSSWIPGN